MSRGRGVVLEENRNPPAVLQAGPDGLVEPRQVRGEPDYLARRVHETGGSQADSAQLSVAGRLANGLGERVLDHGRVHAPARGGSPGDPAHASRGIDDACEHLGATHIDPDAHCFFFRHMDSFAGWAPRTPALPPEIADYRVD